jgi:hypothetical protein
MPGAGLCPAGHAPAGYGTVATGVAPSPGPLPDPATGIALTGRYVNASTGSYQFTSDGRVQGMTTVHQMVVLAAKTLRGSSAVKSMGIDFSRCQVQDSGFQQAVTAAVSQAFSTLIRRNLVRVLGVEFPTTPDNPDAAMPLVRWRDLTTGREGVPVTVGP